MLCALVHVACASVIGASPAQRATRWPCTAAHSLLHLARLPLLPGAACQRVRTNGRSAAGAKPVEWGRVGCRAGRLSSHRRVYLHVDSARASGSERTSSSRVGAGARGCAERGRARERHGTHGGPSSHARARKACKRARMVRVLHACAPGGHRPSLFSSSSARFLDIVTSSSTLPPQQPTFGWPASPLPVHANNPYHLRMRTHNIQVRRQQARDQDIAGSTLAGRTATAPRPCAQSPSRSSVCAAPTTAAAAARKCHRPSCRRIGCSASARALC